MLENGWKFSIPGGKVPSEDFPQATEDKLFGSKYMKEIYFKADPGESFFFLYCFPSVLELVRGLCGARELWCSEETEREVDFGFDVDIGFDCGSIFRHGGYAGNIQSTTLGTPVSPRCPGSPEL
jgi:hypothetical protein